MTLVTPTVTPLQALQAGAPYWRLKQNYADGDWYNCDVTPAAIAIGPDSDLDFVPVTYMDKAAANSTLTKSFLVGVGAPWVNPITAQMDQTNGGSPGRLVLNSGTPYRRADASVAVPVIDLIVYFQVPPAFPSVRAPKFANGTYLTAGGAVSQTVVSIPYYGRNRLALSFYNIDAVKTLTAWSLIGYRFQPGGVNWTTLTHTISPASGSTNTLAAASEASYVLTDARFDVVQLVVTPSASGGYIGYSYEATD